MTVVVGVGGVASFVVVVFEGGAVEGGTGVAGAVGVVHCLKIK